MKDILKKTVALALTFGFALGAQAEQDPVTYLAPVYREVGGIVSPTNGIAEWKTLSTNVYTVVESSASRVTWGTAGTTNWYVVTNGTFQIDGGVACAGHVNLILCDGAKLTVTNVTENYAGIQTDSEGSFSIYGQTGNTGVLDVAGGEKGAGIGGGSNGEGKSITINGGTVTAEGGEYGAGIGGGRYSVGKLITINGGTVMASSAYDGAGIGGGGSANGEDITINGGTVTTEGGTNGAGIGGGDYCSGLRIIIDGGTVTAFGGLYAAGIGGGYHGSSSAVFLKGGTISVCAPVWYAYGRPICGAVIGGGPSGSASDTRISSEARVLFNLTGFYDQDTREKEACAEMPETFDGFTVMTPATQTVDRVLVGGLGDGGAAGVLALSWALTNAVTGATGEIKAGDEGHTPFASTLVRLVGDEDAGTLTLAIDAPTLRFVQTPDATNDYTVVAETDAPDGIVNYAWGAVTQTTMGLEELYDAGNLTYGSIAGDSVIAEEYWDAYYVGFKWLASEIPPDSVFHFYCTGNIHLGYSEFGTLQHDGNGWWTFVPALYDDYGEEYYYLGVECDGSFAIKNLTCVGTVFKIIAEGADVTAFPGEKGEIGSNYVCRVSCVCAGETYTLDAPFTFVGVRMLAQPPVVAGATAKVYTNGVLSAETTAGSGLWNVWSNQTATVVYTAQEPDLYFEDGTETATVALDTSKNPAVPAVAPPVPATPSVMVSNKIAQRYPWNGVVDVSYRVKNWPVNANGCTIRFKVSVADGDWIDAGTATPDGSGTVRGALTIDLKKLGLPTDRGTAKVRGAFERTE